MAMPPDAGAAAPDAAPMADDDAGGSDTDTTDAGDQGTVLLTVLKDADGTYRLIQGDEDDDMDAGAAAGAGTDDGTGAAPMGGGAEGKPYDSKGALLKAILDILNEDEASAGGDTGSSEDQFQSGFGGPTPGGGGATAPAAPAGVMPQKY